jgi:hypothetical protein
VTENCGSLINVPPMCNSAHIDGFSLVAVVAHSNAAFAIATLELLAARKTGKAGNQLPP